MTEEREVLWMKRSEIKRLQVVEKVLGKELKQVEAAVVLGLSSRQVRRLVVRVRVSGERGILHGLRGKVSRRKIADKVRANILKVYRLRYEGFGPTLASEMLNERNGIRISKETLRKWLMEEALWQVRSPGRPRHLRWRERKAHRGEMVQMDGSHHDWLEGRGPWLVLMAWVDDATTRTYARFYDHEGTVPALDSLRRYIKLNGIPSSIYVDRHTTYKAASKETIKDQLEDRKPKSQFEVACEKLGIRVIHAYSPQAKGRVERLFKTLQDRLVKELRLSGARTIEEANAVLEKFLARHNARFVVPSREPGNMHRPWTDELDKEDIFSIHTCRVMRNDYTVVHEGEWFQILTATRAKEVVLRHALNGRLDIIGQGVKLRYQRIPGPISKPKVRRSRLPFSRPAPPKSSPWRKFTMNSKKRTFLLCP